MIISESNDDVDVIAFLIIPFVMVRGSPRFENKLGYFREDSI